MLESVTEDTIRELLKDSRTTSRASFRAFDSSGDVDFQSENIQAAAHDYISSHSNLTDQHKELNNALKLLASESNLSDTHKLPARQPFLPEIDPKGSLATRPCSGSRLNNEQYPNRGSRLNSGRSSAVTVRNSLQDNVMKPENYDFSDAFGGSRDNTPTPPSNQNNGIRSVPVIQKAKPRTLSPIIRNTFD